MSDLGSWLTAQLDHDEQVARAAAAETGECWEASDPGLYVVDDPRQPGPFATGAWGDLDASVAAHAALHDPAAVLRTVAAHRAILASLRDARSRRDYYVRDGEEPFASESRAHVEALELVVRRLAAIYSDREGWDPSWTTEDR